MPSSGMYLSHYSAIRWAYANRGEKYVERNSKGNLDESSTSLHESFFSKQDELIKTLHTALDNFPLEDKLEYYASKGYFVGSSLDFAKIMVNDRTENFGNCDFFLGESVIYTPEKMFLVRGNSPILDFPEIASNFNRRGKLFNLSSELSEFYLNNQNEILDISNFRNKVKCNPIDESLSKFLFGIYSDQTKKEVSKKINCLDYNNKGIPYFCTQLSKSSLSLDFSFKEFLTDNPKFLWIKENKKYPNTIFYLIE